jgi:hypothetical protein
VPDRWRCRHSIRSARRARPKSRDRLLLQTGANTKGSLPGGFHGLWLAEWQKLRQQRPRPAVGQQRTHLCDGPLVLRRASVWHDLGNRIERPSASHCTATRGKARRADLHRAEQRHQSSGALIFEGSLRAAALAASPAAAMILRLNLNEMDLQGSKQMLTLLQRQPDQPRRIFGHGRATAHPHERQRSHPVRLKGSLRSNDHQIETRVRIDGIGHSILLDGIRAGSIVDVCVYDCNAGMSAIKIRRMYSLVGGTGTLPDCKEIYEPLAPIADVERRIFNFLCSDPALRNRQSYPAERAAIDRLMNAPPGVGFSTLSNGTSVATERAHEVEQRQRTLAEDERASAHCP